MPGIIASRVYEPGDVIFTQEPFARAVSMSKNEEECGYCGNRADHLVTCSACSAIKYCGTECQAKDSIDHEMECQKLRLAGDDGPDELIRLIVRVIFKIKDKDWKEITTNVMGTEVSFDDLDSHYQEMTENPRYFLLYKELKEKLKNFIGEDSMPSDDDLIKIIGKVKFSSGNFSTDSCILFCFGMPLFQHECVPNANIDSHSNVFKVWASKRIEVSEEITISRRDILTPFLMRAPINRDSLEVCKCTDCSLPYGTSVLTKVIDEIKAYNVIRLTENVLKMSEVLLELDMQNDPRLIYLVDDLLQQHEGVLGHTNALYLKLLAIKGMAIETEDNERKKCLIELEKHMCSIFGEYYSELGKIYKALALICFKIGDTSESEFYLKKMEKVTLQKYKLSVKVISE